MLPLSTWWILVSAEPQAFNRPRRKIFHQHVYLLNQFAQDGGAFRI